ncbi:unnamed protein product [Clavelina lepadiformis]|uniref:Latrophilin Cirl n=1 Tax=Clavelina lepadiformis TaxID=159417 RepID=A0ABP0GD44_CLALP
MYILRLGRIAICAGCCLILLLLTSNVEGRLNFGLPGGKRFPVSNELACEGYPIVLRCPGTDVIEVVTAEYGRQNAETCATSSKWMKNTACFLPEASDIMSTKCNNKTQCILTVSDQNFPDPCSGTHKYLQVTFRCVKYMFGCPGTLTGIGNNRTFSVPMEPRPGSWSKDSVYNPNHIYFVPSSQLTVQEYENTDDFLAGESIKIYNLPAPISGTNYVIYDGNMYYVKAQSRQILKFNFRSQIRMREGSIPLQNRLSRNRRTSSNTIRLAVDEDGLWVIYTDTYISGRLIISKMNKNTLQIERTWKTSYPHNSALHTFVICGVVYVVGSRSGSIEYMYNTNLNSGNGRSVSIGFDSNRPYSPSDPIGLRGRRSARLAPRRMFSYPAALRSNSRNFVSYNITSLMYNPRERLLYAWEANTATAVFYNLHFGLPDPVEGEKPTTTTTTPPTTTSLTHTSRETAPPSPTLFPDTSEVVPSVPSCPAITRDGINCLETRGDTSCRAHCPNRSEVFAEWRCEYDKATRQAQWDMNGPDMSQCISWISEIETSLKNGEADPLTASNSLSRGLSTITQDDKLITSDDITRTAQIMKEITSVLLESSLSPTETQSYQFVDDVSTSASFLLDKRMKAAWDEMSDDNRYSNVDAIMSSVENAGQVMSQYLAGDLSSQSKVKDSTTVAKPELLLRVDIVQTPRAETVVFPRNSNNPASEWSNVEDKIIIPRETIRKEQHDVTSLIFALYNNLGTFAKANVEGLEPAEDWKIDSRVISASLVKSEENALRNPSIRFVLKNLQVSEAQRKCVYWSYSQSLKIGSWRTDGCEVVTTNSTYTECSCNHLTSFAVLVNVAATPLPSPTHKLALSIVSSIGVSVSLVCLAICIYTFSAFRNLQNDRNTIHKHLCLSLFVAEAVFLIGINQTFNRVPCAVIAGILHYTFLAAFMWMALEGFQLYVMLVEIFEGRSRWKWYYLIGYGVPAVIVGVSAAVDSNGYGSTQACWLKVDSGFIWSFVGPVCAVILCNLVFLSITIFKMYRHTISYTDASKVNSVKAAVRGASVLLCLLGITWAFGILWVWEQAPIMAYLFCVFNAFQGLFIFVFHCLLQKKVRSEYSRCIDRTWCCRKRSPESYVSNSMSFSKQYTPARYSSATTHNSTATTQATSSQGQLQRMWNETLVGTHPNEGSMLNSHNMPAREKSCTVPNQRRAITQQHSSSSTQLRRMSDDRMLDAKNESNQSRSHEDEMFVTAKAPCLPHDALVGQVGEDAYDHLQRHCHPNELYGHERTRPCTHDGECAHIQHSNTCRADPYKSQPRLQAHSKTMNHIKALQSRDLCYDKEDVNLQRRPEFQRASTLSNTTSVASALDWEKGYPIAASRRFSQPTRSNESTCSHCEDPHPETRRLLTSNTSTPSPTQYDQHSVKLLRPIAHHSQRRSITSSESDDPIVNDFSASSSAGSSCGNPASLTRTIGGRQSLISSTIIENQDNHINYETRPYHPEGWSGHYRDENDLEVQRLTDPVPSNCKTQYKQSEPCSTDSQRDSAFYQSTPDLDSSPAMHCISKSRDGSPDITTNVTHRHGLKASDKHRYVMTPVAASQERGTVKDGMSDGVRASEGTRRTSVMSEDSLCPDRNNFNAASDSYYDGRRESGEILRTNIPHGAEYSQDYESRAILDSTGRMMTCL